MEQQTVEAVALAGSVAGDLSIWSLIVRADLIVKLVLLLLLSASVWSWAIIFDKIKKIRKITNKTEIFEDQFWSGGSLEDLYDLIAGYVMRGYLPSCFERLKLYFECCSQFAKNLRWFGRMILFSFGGMPSPRFLAWLIDID